MYTQCPDCATVYEITTEQLGAAGGLVSCGSCEATFNALRRLTSSPPQSEAESNNDAEPATDNLQSELQFDAEDTISGTVDLPDSEETEHSDEQSLAETADDSDNGEQDDDFDLDLISADDIEVVFDDVDAGELEAREDLVDELLDDIDLITGDDDLIVTDEIEETSPESHEDDSEVADDTEETSPENLEDNSEVADDTEETSPESLEDDSEVATEEDRAARSNSDYEAGIEELIQKAEVEIGAIDESKRSAAEAEKETDADAELAESEEDKSADDVIEIDGLSEEDWNTEDGEQVLEALLSDENLLEDDADSGSEDSDQDEDQRDDSGDSLAPEETSDEDASDQDQDQDKSTDTGDVDEVVEEVPQDDETEKVVSDTEDDTTIDDGDAHDVDGSAEESDDAEEISDQAENSEDDSPDAEEDDTADSPPDENDADADLETDNGDAQESDFLEDDELAAHALDPLLAPSQEAVSKDSQSDTATVSANDEPDILTQEVDGSFDQDINDAHDYRDLQRYLKPAKSLPRKIGEWVVVIALVTALGAQFVHQNRESLVDNPKYGDRLRDVYKRLGISLIDHWDVTDYRVARHTVVPHSEESNVLQARATIINGAASSRPVPLIRFELQNRWGDPIFSRTFTADEYAASPPRGDMRPNARLEVVLDLVNPTEEAVFNYNFDVCLPAKDQRVYCAADQVFTQK